ncbi:MAG: DUF4215 domain-containing protein [Candidatus Peribacteraceae bacterium]
MTPIYTRSPVHFFTSGFLIAVLLVGAFHAPERSTAQTPADSVCGDKILDIGEQCDDGNLLNGDGCSNKCQLEICGNSIVDRNEQCDDGNTKNSDGCSAQCFIEFCGDGILQELLSEQCDDKNTVNGDGCSSKCQKEVPLIGFCPYTDVMQRNLKKLHSYFKYSQGAKPPKNHFFQHSWTEKDIAMMQELLVDRWLVNKPMTCAEYQYLFSLLKKATLTRIKIDGPIIVPNPEPLPDKEKEKTTGSTSPSSGSTGGSSPSSGGSRGNRDEQVKKAGTFLASATGKGVYDRLKPEARGRLDEILRRYRQGRGLTQDELLWITSLADQIMLAKQAEEKLYTDLLNRFTSTDISRGVLEANQLLRDHLVDVEIPTAVAELEKAVAIVERGELKEEVQRALNRLQRQQVRIESAPLVASSSFDEAARPIETFSALVALKDDAEKVATPSIPGSASVIALETQQIRDALPYLAETHDVDSEEVTALLDLIDIRSKTVDVYSAERYVSTVNRLTNELQRSGIEQIQDPQTFALITTDTLARADRVSTEYAPRFLTASFLTTTTEQTPYEELDVITSYAPAEYRPAFTEGTTDEQREALQSFLESNDRLGYLRETLEERGESDQEKYDALLQDIERIGIDDLASTSCDDSVQAGMDCADAYMASLQETVRSGSLWTRIVGSVQDVFGL